MSPLPLAAFPLAAKADKPTGFVIAVLIGLALFAASQQRKPRSQPK